MWTTNKTRTEAKGGGAAGTEVHMIDYIFHKGLDSVATLEDRIEQKFRFGSDWDSTDR